MTNANGLSGINSVHELLYIGIARGKGGLDGRLTTDHDKFSELKQAKSNHIGIHLCKIGDDPKKIETDILDNYYFKFNKQENNDIEDKEHPFIVIED